MLHPAYYRRICGPEKQKFARFATRVWGIPAGGKSEEELAHVGVEALAGFIQELGLPTTLRQLGLADAKMLPVIADSCNLEPASCPKITKEEILTLLQACV